MKKFSLTVLVVLLLSAVSAAPASADKPVAYEDPWEQVATVDCGAYGFGSTLTEVDANLSWGNIWFGADGMPEKIVEHVQGTAYLTNDDTGAQLTYQVRYEAHYNFYSWDPLNATVAYSGVGVNLQLPGEGIVLHDAGHAVFSIDPWLQLQHVGLNMFDWATVCEALAE